VGRELRRKMWDFGVERNARRNPNPAIPFLSPRVRLLLSSPAAGSTLPPALPHQPAASPPLLLPAPSPSPPVPAPPQNPRGAAAGPASSNSARCCHSPMPPTGEWRGPRTEGAAPAVGGHGDVRAQAAAALLHGVRVELANLGKLTISSPLHLHTSIPSCSSSSPCRKGGGDGRPTQIMLVSGRRQSKGRPHAGAAAVGRLRRSMTPTIQKVLSSPPPSSCRVVP
jgi:hypothetical protein